MSPNTCVEECLICAEEEPVCGCGECPPICATCASLLLPRILAHAVLANRESPCSYTQLQLALHDVHARYWQEAAYLLHAQVPGHAHDDEDNPQVGDAFGRIRPDPSVN
jgi:hypothetical protein